MKEELINKFEFVKEIIIEFIDFWIITININITLIKMIKSSSKQYIISVYKFIKTNFNNLIMEI